MLRPDGYREGRGTNTNDPFKRESGLSDLAADPPHNILKPQRAGLSRQFTPVTQEHQRRDTDDAEPRSQCLFFLRVHFGQANLRFQHLRGLFIGRGHHPAGTAPGRPEIYHQRNFRTLRMELKIRRSQRDRMPGKEGRVALAAIGLLRQASCRNSIDTPAMRADQMERLRHNVTCSTQDPARLPIALFPFTTPATASHPSMPHAAHAFSPPPVPHPSTRSHPFTVAMSIGEGAFILDHGPDFLVGELPGEPDHAGAG